jgi:hypothetical protein
LVGSINVENIRETAIYITINDLKIILGTLSKIIPFVGLRVFQEFESNLALS